MVNEIADFNRNTNQERTFQTLPTASGVTRRQQQQNLNSSGRKLSWKFFDNAAHLDARIRGEYSGDLRKAYANEEIGDSLNDLVILGNSNFHIPQQSRQPHLQLHYKYKHSPSLSVNVRPSLVAGCSNHRNQASKTSINNINNNGPNASLTLTTRTTSGSGGPSGSSNIPHQRGPGTATTMAARTKPGTSTGAKAKSRVTTTNFENAGVSGSTNIAGFHIELYGWRKKCLFVLILALMLLIIVNLVLTLWILKVMEFSWDGMGQLRIVAGGIQLSGQALFLDLLRASAIRSRHGQPISIESSRNFSINTRDPDGYIENQLFLGHDRLECLANGFRINDTQGRNLFSVNRNKVSIGSHTLKIDGEGGAIFRKSVQTPLVKAEPGKELRLESVTRKMEIFAAKNINIISKAGAIDINALSGIKLHSIAGNIRLDSPNVVFSNLKIAQPLANPSPNRNHASKLQQPQQHIIYQLCVCDNGKLFLAQAHSICAGEDSTVCR